VKINNEIYNERGDRWWDSACGEFASIRFIVNPVRFGYFMKILHMNNINYEGMTVLDVGCGGGFLSEEFAKAGFSVTGIDPSEKSIETARRHAQQNGLVITYAEGSGESLPFSDRAFDIVACCDVLEHVDDPGKVMSEISRVLKPGGVFLYDTINRTFMSWIAVIKSAQAWSSTGFCTDNSHLWRMFIKPRELYALMAKCTIRNRETRGLSKSVGNISCLLDMRRSVKGKISFEELGRRLKFRESDDLSVSYMGYGTKD